MRCYKLTNLEMQTYGGFQWELGEWNRVCGEGPLCSKAWFHAYEHPLLAVLFNPIHANFQAPRIFEASYDGRCRHRPDRARMKIGVQRLRLDKEIALRYISTAALWLFIEDCAKHLGRTNSATTSAEDRGLVANTAARAAQELGHYSSLLTGQPRWLEMIEYAIDCARKAEDWTPRYEPGISGHRHQSVFEDEFKTHGFVRPKDGIVPLS